MAAPEGKIFNDPVHGHIEMPDLCVKIIDTPQFQRLRNIKQLGGCYYVYPGAAHNRFEHSIGTAHLAGCLVESLKTKQDLGISEKDVLCVKIAGLCHDLGHGPFSHLFDGSFIPKASKEKWKHEKASLDMFDLIYKNLKNDFEQHEVGVEDATFIKELIDGPLGDQDGDYKGRPKDKWFLYEIISNEESGIDVDKWDYFARDCLHLGMKSGFDHMRCIKMARVIKAEDGKRHICFRDKEVHNIYEMFHLRANLHRRAYQHKTSNAVQHMITEALLKADPYLQFEGKDGKMLMSQAIYDMVAYTKLTDQVYYQILHSTDEGLKGAKNILERIECRKLYRLIGEHTATEKYMSVIFPIQSEVAKKENPKKANEEDIILDCEKVKEEILKMDEILKEAKVDEITKEDIILDKVKFDYGSKEKDPVTKVYFYKKQEPAEAFHIKKEEVSDMLPEVFNEWKIRLYLRKELDEAKTDKLRGGFDQWFEQQGAGDNAAGRVQQVTTEKDSSAGSSDGAPATKRQKKLKK